MYLISKLIFRRAKNNMAKDSNKIDRINRSINYKIFKKSF